MKRLIMFALPLLLVVGISNAQGIEGDFNHSQWKTEQITWSSSTTSPIAVKNTTLYSDVITMPLTVAGGQISQAGVVRSEKFPSRFSIQLITTEATGDSSNSTATLQFSYDNVTYYDYTPIDTVTSITTANEVFVDYSLFTSFPEIRYARVKTVTLNNTVTDTLTYQGIFSKSFTQ